MPALPAWAEERGATLEDMRDAPSSFGPLPDPVCHACKLRWATVPGSTCTTCVDTVNSSR